MIHNELQELIKVVTKLRDPVDGCPWDLEQTHQSLLKYLLEESYEFIQATEENNASHMQEELGDVLLQVLLHAVIGEQNKTFTLEDVAKTLREKLIVRHPHVFNKKANLSPEEVAKNWQQIKEETKGKKEHYIELKELNAPSLTSAFNIGVKSQKIKFDWEKPLQVAYKVEEEWQELKEEMANWPSVNHKRVEEELGDLLFSVSQLARHLNVNPELALKKANEKFIKRFNKMENKIKAANLDILSMNQTEMDHFWNDVKSDEKTK